MVTLTVLGGGGEVGRMAILVRGRDKAILLDYGVNFDNEGRPVFPLHVRPKDLAAVVLSHAHLDHCGALPELYISASPPLYTTALTSELAEIMFRDAIKLSGYYLPYEVEEVRNALRRVNPVSYGDEIDLGGGDSLKFINAGHVPGSSMILVDIDGVKILFTGDFNLAPTNLLNGADLYSVPRNVDAVVMEATYAGGTHPPRDRLESDFVNAVKETIESGGSVLLPSFTIGRAQELLVTLVKAGLVEAPIYVDGLARIANRIISKYPQFLRDPNLYAKAMRYSVEVMSSQQRRSIVKERSIIITPAGMLKGGAALFYLKHIAGDDRNAVILPSYQAPDSNGFELLSRGFVNIDKARVEVRAKVYWFDFSAHSGLQELMSFISYFSEDTKIIMVHTTPSSAFRLASQFPDRPIHVTLSPGEDIEI